MYLIKFLFTLLLLTTCLGNTQAQAHISSGDYKCDLVPSSLRKGTEAAICPACLAKREKERLAKEALKKRKDEAQIAKNRADEIESKRKLEKSHRESEKEQQVTGLTIENRVYPMTVSPVKNKNNLSQNINVIYDIWVDNPGPYTQEYNEQYYRNTHHIKILRNTQVAFESNDYSTVDLINKKKAIFVLKFASTASPCLAEYGNNSILIDDKGKKITLPGIEKFGVFFKNSENEDYFDIAVYTGKCTEVEDDKYATADRHTILYTFSYKTMLLIESKPSWQHVKCNCE